MFAPKFAPKKTAGIPPLFVIYIFFPKKGLTKLLFGCILRVNKGETESAVSLSFSYVITATLARGRLFLYAYRYGAFRYRYRAHCALLN